MHYHVFCQSVDGACIVAEYTSLQSAVAHAAIAQCKHNATSERWYRFSVMSSREENMYLAASKGACYGLNSWLQARILTDRLAHLVDNGAITETQYYALLAAR